MAKDPAEEFRRELREFMNALSTFGTRLALVEQQLEDIKWFRRVVLTGVVLAWIGAAVALLKGH